MQRVFDNFWIKATAVVMGLLLWFHVATEKVYNHELQLPLTEIVLKDGLTLSNFPPDSVTVIVSANGKKLLRRAWRRLGVRVNAVQLGIGRYNIPLNADNASLVTDDITVILDEIVAPTDLKLNVDRLQIDTVAVIPNLITQTDDGFAVARIVTPTPEVVILQGPATALAQVREVMTERKELIGLRNNVELLLPLILPDGYGVFSTPESVTVIVEVVPVKTRVFEELPIIVYNPPQGKRVVLQPGVVGVELTGPPLAIDGLPAHNVIASIDYNSLVAGITETAPGRAAVKIVYPSQYKLRRATVDSVDVIIR